MQTPCPAEAGSSPPVRVIQPHGESIAAAGRPTALFVRFWHQRALLRRFAWRNVTMRYRGSFLGLLWAPLCWLPILAIAVGGGLGLSAVGVFVRDVGPLVAIGLSVLFFLTPMIVNLRRALLVDADQRPDLTELGVSLLIGAGVFWIGTLTFLKARKAFADVI